MYTNETVMETLLFFSRFRLNLPFSQYFINETNTINRLVEERH